MPFYCPICIPLVSFEYDFCHESCVIIENLLLIRIISPRVCISPICQHVDLDWSGARYFSNPTRFNQWRFYSLSASLAALLICIHLNKKAAPRFLSLTHSYSHFIEAAVRAFSHQHTARLLFPDQLIFQLQYSSKLTRAPARGAFAMKKPFNSPREKCEQVSEWSAPIYLNSYGSFDANKKSCCCVRKTPLCIIERPIN